MSCIIDPFSAKRKIVDTGAEGIVYTGFAPSTWKDDAGAEHITAEDDPVWNIQRTTTGSPMVTSNAGGNNYFDKKFSERETLSYF